MCISESAARFMCLFHSGSTEINDKALPFSACLVYRLVSEIKRAGALTTCTAHTEEEKTPCTQDRTTKAQQCYWRDLGKVCEDASIFSKTYQTARLYVRDVQVHMFTRGLLCPQARAFGGGKEERITIRAVGWPHSCSLAGGKRRFLLQVESDLNLFNTLQFYLLWGSFQVPGVQVKTLG